MSLGSSQPAPQVVRSFSDPQSARVNCAGGTAAISGPGDEPTPQSAIDYSLGWTHNWKHGYLSTDFYQQTQAGQLVTALLPASAGGVPPDISSAVGTYYASVCPSFPGPKISTSPEPVNGTNRLYQGYDITARRLALGKGNHRDPVVLDQRFPVHRGRSGVHGQRLSTLILNSQIYGRPLHKGNFTIDAFHPPSNLEFIANAQFVGVNNSQHLAPYVNVSFGVTHPFGIGMLTLFETNAFNTQTALFSTINGAQPQPLVGGGFLLVAANPLPPRTIQISYSINTGARRGAAYALRGVRGGGTLRAAAEAQPGASPAPNGLRGGLAFGQLHFVPPPDAASTLSVATSRAECTAELQPLATTALAELGAAATRICTAGTSPLPAVAGVSVTPHGDPKGAWYFALGPNIPRDLFPRPQNGGGAGGGQRGPRPPGGGGPGGPGGEERPAGLPVANQRGAPPGREQFAAARVHAEPGARRGAAAVPRAGVVRVRQRAHARRRESPRLRHSAAGGIHAAALPAAEPGTEVRAAPAWEPAGSGLHRLRTGPGTFLSCGFRTRGTGGGSVKQP